MGTHLKTPEKKNELEKKQKNQFHSDQLITSTVISSSNEDSDIFRNQ